jgi:hypothetical protein
VRLLLEYKVDNDELGFEREDPIFDFLRVSFDHNMVADGGDWRSQIVLDERPFGFGVAGIFENKMDFHAVQPTTLEGDMRSLQFGVLLVGEVEGDFAKVAPDLHVEDVAVLERLQAATTLDEFEHRLFAVEEGLAPQGGPLAVAVKEADVPAFVVMERHQNFAHGQIVGEVKAKIPTVVQVTDSAGVGVRA